MPLSQSRCCGVGEIVIGGRLVMSQVGDGGRLGFREWDFWVLDPICSVLGVHIGFIVYILLVIDDSACMSSVVWVGEDEMDTYSVTG